MIFLIICLEDIRIKKFMDYDLLKLTIATHSLLHFMKIKPTELLIKNKHTSINQILIIKVQSRHTTLEKCHFIKPVQHELLQLFTKIYSKTSDA